MHAQRSRAHEHKQARACAHADTTRARMYTNTRACTQTSLENRRKYLLHTERDSGVRYVRPGV